MDMKFAHIISYSPTGTTHANLREIAEGMGLSATNDIDLTLPSGLPEGKVTLREGVALIGVPVYAGRVAPVAAKRLKTIRGNNTPAVILVVYGNRHYDNALYELKSLVKASGFVVVAAAALLGEHSFSTAEKPIAKGRPDEKDKTAARRFGASVLDKLAKQDALYTAAPLELPGTLPDGPYAGPANIAPETDPDLCMLCGLCAQGCPTGAITVDGAVSTDASRCTLCCACVKACPQGAVSVTAPKLVEIAGFLHDNFKARREPELFL